MLILTPPVEGKECTIISDVSKNEFGFILIQGKKVIAYTFQQLKPCKRNYLTYDVDLASMILHRKCEVIICL